MEFNWWIFDLATTHFRVGTTKYFASKTTVGITLGLLFLEESLIQKVISSSVMS